MLVVAVLFAATTSFGQVSATGKISDGAHPLPLVTVILLSKDSTWIRTATTNDAGEFVFAGVNMGEYILSVSMVGYQTFFSSMLTFGENENRLPEIIIKESTTELGEVIVKTQKQLFDQQIDRLVVNVESSITSSGNTVLEVLQKSPGIVINKQNGLISMNGKTGVLVMVNGKMMRLPMDVMVSMLDGMNASGVEKIELITTPPAKYDADGNAGVIHIVTKGSGDIGTNLSLGLTAGAKWAETFGGNGLINHRSNSLAYFVDYSFLRTHNLHTVIMERMIENKRGIQTVIDDSRRENITTQQNLNFGIEGKVSKHTSINLLLTAFRRNWDMQANATDIYHAKADSTVVTSMSVHESNVWESGMSSLGLTRAIDSNSTLNINLDYLFYRNNNPSQYHLMASNEQQNAVEYSRIDLEKTTPIRVFVSKTDYQRQVSQLFSWEAGVKAVSSSLSNNVLVRKTKNGVSQIEKEFTSDSDLREKVIALYFSSKWRAENKWQVNTGLRYEHTQTIISTPSVAKLVDRKYGYLFPSVVVRNQIDAGRDVQFSYSRRITRPTYYDIAPFVFFWSPNTFSAGNTSLYPAIADAVSATYHRNQWILSVHFTHSKNDIAFLQPEVEDDSGNLIYRSQNMKYMNVLSATNSYSMSLAHWFEAQSNITIQRQVAKTTHLANDAKTDLYGINVNIICQLRLPKYFSMEVSGMYQSRSLTGISQYLPFGSLNAGVQKDLGKNGFVKFSIDDLLNTNNWLIETQSSQNNLDTYFNYNWHNRYIRLTYTWKLGNNRLRTVKMKSGSEEERQRLN